MMDSMINAKSIDTGAILGSSIEIDASAMTRGQ